MSRKKDGTILDDLAELEELRERNARLVAALEVAEETLLIHCPKCGVTLQQIRQALDQQ